MCSLLAWHHLPMCCCSCLRIVHQSPYLAILTLFLATYEPTMPLEGAILQNYSYSSQIDRGSQIHQWYVIAINWLAHDCVTINWVLSMTHRIHQDQWWCGLWIRWTSWVWSKLQFFCLYLFMWCMDFASGVLVATLCFFCASSVCIHLVLFTSWACSAWPTDFIVT